MTNAAERGLLELDTTDVARMVGQPVGGLQFKEPFATNDIRRFVQGMQNPNPLYFDDDYAAQSRFGRIVAPQSYFGGGVGAGATASIQGFVAGSHMLFGGDEFWFFGPRIYPGDKLLQDRMLYDFKLANTSFAGPTLFTRGDTLYINQNGESIARQRSTSIRYLVENARRLASFAGQQEEPEWTDEELEGIELEKIRYIKTHLQLGHGKRLWKDVKVGERLPRRVIGPHSVQSFTTEKRTDAGPQEWGAFYRTDRVDNHIGWLPEMSRDPELMKINPAVGDGVFFGPSRGHTQARWARTIGMPRAYGYGASMGAWINDYLSNWAGEWGSIVHVNSQYRNPALAGDVTYQDAEVIEKFVDEQGRSIVQIRHEMANQQGVTMARGVGELQLPNE